MGLPVCLKKLCWLLSWLTCQVPMLPSECTHSSGTGGWSQCHSLFSSSSTTKPESTYSETTHQATGSNRKPTTKRHVITFVFVDNNLNSIFKKFYYFILKKRNTLIYMIAY